MRALAALLLAAAGAAPFPASAQDTGGEIYRARCASCHDAGARGAPRPGVVADWQQRAAKGRPALIRQALRMAPHLPGNEANEVTAAVDFMLSTVDIMVNSYSEPPRLESGR
jgi:cytochrome c5